MECKVTRVMRLEDSRGTPIDGWIVIGEVVGVHIDSKYLKDGFFDTAAARPIARCGYRGDYAEVNRIFEMIRPA
jgi:flavin reductase (DIM6/NTAB) family NADH-FMN oxidoreductase RutF